MNKDDGNVKQIKNIRTLGEGQEICKESSREFFTGGGNPARRYQAV